MSNEIRVSIQADNRLFLNALKECREGLKALDKLSAGLKLKAALDVSGAKASVGEFADFVRRMDGTAIRLFVDGTQARTAAEEAAAALYKIAPKQISISVAAETALGAIRAVAAEMDKIAGKNIHLTASGGVSETTTRRVSAAREQSRTSEMVSSSARMSSQPSRLRFDVNTSQLRQAQSELSRLSAQASETQTRIGSMHFSVKGGGSGGAFSGIMNGAGAALEAIGKLKDAAAAVVMPGFEHWKEMETKQASAASILAAKGSVDGQGVDLDAARQMSDDIFRNLQKEAFQTSATPGDLMRTFTAMLSPGLDAGMNVGQLEKLSSLTVNAGNALNLSPEQATEEMRNILAGGLPENSNIMNKLGITGEEIEAAKNSAGGLFAFLEERMSGLAGNAARTIPDTIEGKLSTLDASFKTASAEITKAFEPEIKAVAGMLTDMLVAVGEDGVEVNPAIMEFIESLQSGIRTAAELFGAFNEETGAFYPSEEALGFVNELGECFNELKTWVDMTYDAIMDMADSSSFSWVEEYAVPTVGLLWDAFKDIIGIVGDLWAILLRAGGVIANVTAPFREFIWDIISAAANEVAYLIGQIREFMDELASLAGAKTTAERDAERERARRQSKDEKERKEAEEKARRQRQEEERAKIAGARRQAPARTSAGGGVDRGGENERRQRIKASQDALKQMLNYWKEQLDDIQRAFKMQQDDLKLQLDRGAIGSDEYYRRKIKSQIELKEQIILNTEREIAAIQGAEYDDPARKKEALAAKERALRFDKEERNLLIAANKELDEKLNKANAMPHRYASREMMPGADAERSSFLTEDSSRIDRIVYEKARAYEVDPYLVKAIIEQESHGNADAVSGAGAQGVMQLMPGTAAEMGVTDSFDLEQNIEGGVKYLKKMLDTFGGDFRLALAGYNGGPGAARDPGAQAAETRAYVPQVLEKYETLLAAAAERRTNAIAIGAGEGTTWYRVAEENPKYDALDDKAKQALEVAAAVIQKHTGKAAGLTSGKRSADLGYSDGQIGGHGTGLKFDLTAEFENPSIRAQVVKELEAYGLRVLDEYAKLSEKGTGPHLDINAENFQATAGGGESTAVYRSREVFDAVQKHMDMRKKARDILQVYAEMMGDVHTYQIAALEEQRIETRNMLKLYPEDQSAREALSVLDHVIENQRIKIDFSQAQQDFERISAKSEESQEAIVNSISDFSGSASAAFDAWIRDYRGRTDALRAKLEALFKRAEAEKNEKDISMIRALIKKIDDGLALGLANLLSVYDKEIQLRIAEVNADRKLTRRQKQDALDELERENYANKAREAEEKIRDYRKEDQFSGKNENKYKILEQERIAKLNWELAKTPTLLEKIHAASKQALEDGLLDFLERGILECESLGDAFKKLAISILQSIQKIYAEELTKNIMNSLFPKEPDKNKPDATKGTDQENKDSPANTELGQASIAGQMISSVASSLMNMLNGTQTLPQNIESQQQTGISKAAAGMLGNEAGQVISAMQIYANKVYVQGQAEGSPLANANPANTVNEQGKEAAGGLIGTLSSLFTNLFSGIGTFFGSIFRFAEGGTPGTINSKGRISGPGTSTSDNILAWVSPGEWIVKAETVRKVGPKFMERLNSGEIYNLQIPIPKYARGGAVGTVGSRSASRGMEMFSQDIGMSVSPKINVNNYVDGQRIFDAYGKPMIRSEARKEYIENMKMYSQLGKRIR